MATGFPGVSNTLWLPAYQAIISWFDDVRCKMFLDFFHHKYSLAIVCIVLVRLILNKKTFNEPLTSNNKLL